MAEEAKQDVEETKPVESNQDVEETKPEGENQDELDSILDALGKDETVVTEDDKSKETPSEDKDAKPFKVLGKLAFKTEAEFDAWALKQNGEVSRLSGELKKAQEIAKTNPTQKTITDVNALRMQIKVADFFDANPSAVEHKDVIAALIRSKKATTLEDAFAKAQKVLGIEAEEKTDTDDVKNLLKVGGSEGGVGSGSYKSQEEIKGMSDFADSALTNRI